MEVKKFKIKYIKEKACSKYYKDIIYGYFEDSEIKDDNQLNEHIKICSKCNKLFNSIKASTLITSSLKAHKNEFVNSLNNDDVVYYVDKIMEKVTLENTVAKTNKKTYERNGFINWLSGLFSLENYKKVIIPLGSVAAVIAVFFFINTIFFSHNNFSLFPTKNSLESIENAAGENRDNVDFLPETSNENELSENDDQKSKDLSNLPTNDEYIPESGRSYVLQSYFDNGVNHDLSEKINFALNYYEFVEDNKYIGVFSFKTGDTNTINEKLTNILDENGISAEIKIITGVNKEKLVEYIDRETMNNVFSDNFTGDVDYLVILIGR